MKSGTESHSRHAAVPDWLVGLWRRSEIVFADGSSDSTTSVYWGQTHTLFVDLRIPAERPAARGRCSFDDFSLDELRTLADQKGFAGHIVVEGDACSWIRYIDYRPNNGRPDQGRLRIDGDTLYEEGDPSSVLGAAYREIYQRERGAGHRSIALRRSESTGSSGDRTDALLVVIDDRFLHARARAVALPRAESLRELVTAAGADRDLIHRYLDCEVSYGSVDGDLCWQITASTIPFREGQRLLPRGFFTVPDAPDRLLLDGPSGRQSWSVVECSLPVRALAELINR